MRHFVQRFRKEFRPRFRDDYQFAMIMLFGSMAVLVISGFVIYRYAYGYYLGGTVNLMIVIGMSLVLFYAIRSGRTARAGRFFVVVTVLACIASTAIFGRTGILWGYVVLWINFLLTTRQFALVANLLLITALIIETRLFQSPLEGVTYIVTTLLVTTFGFIFAERLARYQDQLETLALQDPLTYAGNRRMLRRDLAAAVSSQRRNGTAFVLVLIDLDWFKCINDDQGHDTGDQALCDFADLMRRNIRAEDGLYRFGGEEFVLLMPEYDGEDALELARSLHRRTSGKLSFEDHHLRYSAGVAQSQPGEDWPDWLRRADQAMYEAKRAGRDCVVLAPRESQAHRGAVTSKPERLEGADF